MYRHLLVPIDGSPLSNATVGQAVEFARLRTGSVTQRLLQVSTLPVLVAAVESNLPRSDAQRAVATAFADHGDPRFGADADEPYERLFARLLNLATGAADAVRHDRA